MVVFDITDATVTSRDVTTLLSVVMETGRLHALHYVSLANIPKKNQCAEARVHRSVFSQSMAAFVHPSIQVWTVSSYRSDPPCD